MNQENQQVIQQNIPTIRHTLQELQQSYENLGAIFLDSKIIPLKEEQNLEHKKVRLKDVIRRIPDDQTLQLMLAYSNRSWIPDIMEGYKGEYELIRTACKNFNQLKKQQKKLYYLAVQLNLPKISHQFEDPQPTNLYDLSSYKDVALIKKQAIHKLQKNAISPHYFEDLQEQFMQIGKIASKNPQQYLQKYQHLINVCYYDSCNGQKLYEFACLGTQNLQSLVEKFDCMMLQLQSYYNYSQTSEPLLFAEDIYQKKKQKKRRQASPDEFLIQFNEEIPVSLNDPYNNFEREKQQIFQNSLEYILIGNSIYYSGNKQQLEKILSSLSIKKKKRRYYKMSDAKIDDLRIIFGHPYVYRHLRGCDHFIIFKEARLFLGYEYGNFQVADKNQYPFKVYQNKMKRKKCEGCNEKFAEIASISDPLKQGDNLFICRECHENLHLDINGQLKYPQLKLIPYIHD